jgi:hypothetical protein
MTRRMLSRLVRAFSRATEPASQHADHPVGEIAKLVPRQVHQFNDCPEPHCFLHLSTAPIAAFGEGLATEEADASRATGTQ